MTGNEVGVEVAEKDMADLESVFFGIIQVLLDVALGVDDDRGRTGLISEQIGGVGQAAQVVLFKNHLKFLQSSTQRCRRADEDLINLTHATGGSVELFLKVVVDLL